MLDSGALLNTNSFSHIEGAITTPRVADEIKSRAPLIEAYVESGLLEIREPREQSIEEIRKIAKSIGELDKLSGADVEVLALALETEATLVTDDYHVQNVAAAAGIPFEGVTGKIRRAIRWIKRCTGCGRVFPYSYRGKRCPYCGGRIVVTPQRQSSPRRSA